MNMDPHQRRDVRRHDGFYFRFAAGLGVFVDSVDSSAVGSASLLGAASTSELLFGGTPSDGFVLFGGLAGVTTATPTLKIEGKRADGPDLLNLSLVGAGSDVYFDPSRGWHAQLMIGFAVLAPDDGDADENPTGFGIVLGAGHEWWVGEQWSIGIMPRLTYASLSFESSSLNESHSIFVPGLVASFTHH